MKKFVVLFIAVLLSTPLMAQDAPKAEVFGGYQYLHFGSSSDLGTSSGQGFNGWNAAGQFNFTKFAGVEGDFSGTYATISGVKTHVYTYTGGPVVFAYVGKIKPFVHVLFGGVRLTGTESGVSLTFSGYTAMAGGGVDVKVNKVLGVRLAQFDWVYYHFGSQTVGDVQFSSISGSKNVRISTGIVARF